MQKGLNNKPTVIKDVSRKQLTVDILNDVLEHREVQIGVWGTQPQNTAERWLTIATAEFGEIADALMDTYHSDKPDWNHVYEEVIHTMGVLASLAEKVKRDNPSVGIPNYNIPQMRKDRGLD